VIKDSELLRPGVFVLRATAPPDAQFAVLDESAREIGRVVGEGRLSRGEPARLLLYDRQDARVLTVERRDSDNDGVRQIEATVLDDLDRPLGKGLFTMKRQGRIFRRRTAVFFDFTIRDHAKTDVGGFTMARPPQGDQRLGATYLFTNTAEATSQVRLAALGFCINFVERESRKPGWMLTRLANGGIAWPGGTDSTQ
jgi:hypothetical protein